MIIFKKNSNLILVEEEEKLAMACVTPSSCTFGESPSSIVIIIRDEIYRNLI
jgi:hypothetical protein